MTARGPCWKSWIKWKVIIILYSNSKSEANV